MMEVKDLNKGVLNDGSEGSKGVFSDGSKGSKGVLNGSKISKGGLNE